MARRRIPQHENQIIPEQFTTYEAPTGWQLYVNSSRIDHYVELGTPERPFKTITAALAADGFADVPASNGGFLLPK